MNKAHMVNAMTQDAKAEALRLQADKAVEYLIVAQDYWEDGATEDEIAVSLDAFITATAQFSEDAASYPPLALSGSLALLKPCIEITRAKHMFYDRWTACDGLAAMLYDVQKLLGGSQFVR